jgi:hypothetical protein
MVKEFNVGNYYLDTTGIIFRFEKSNPFKLYFTQIVGPKNAYVKNKQGYIEFSNNKTFGVAYEYFKDLGDDKKVIEVLYGK